MGAWTIKAKVKNYEKKLKIRVEKYVLPKFQVTIEPPSYVTEMMKVTTAKVCARYVLYAVKTRGSYFFIS